MDSIQPNKIGSEVWWMMRRPNPHTPMEVTSEPTISLGDMPSPWCVKKKLNVAGNTRIPARCSSLRGRRPRSRAAGSPLAVQRGAEGG